MRSRARAADVLPYVEAARRAGAKTLRELAAALTARGVPAPAGGRAWHPMQVKRVVAAGDATGHNLSSPLAGPLDAA